jgi:hypothetical protein
MGTTSSSLEGERAFIRGVLQEEGVRGFEPELHGMKREAQ